MSHVIQGLIYGWRKNREYGPKLVADLAEEQLVAQPAKDPELPSNHPAWVFSHLNAYLPVISAIIQAQDFEDPKNHPFGMLSKPQSDPSIYPSKQALVDRFVQGHEEVIELLNAADDSIFQNPVRLERWKNVMPNAGLALPYLMLNHENNHLGQISAWRRIQGFPSV